MIERFPYFVAFLHPPLDGTVWRVAFPDFPGCTATGDDFLAALSNGREALSELLSGHVNDGHPVPVPGTWEELRPAALRAGAYPQSVTPRFIAPERLRVNISIGADILRLADEWADANGMTRSGMIESALERHLSTTAA